MKRIITYDELPNARGESIYLRMETDPALYTSLLSKGYRIINHIKDADEQHDLIMNEEVSVDDGIAAMNEGVQAILAQ